MTCLWFDHRGQKSYRFIHDNNSLRLPHNPPRNCKQITLPFLDIPLTQQEIQHCRNSTQETCSYWILHIFQIQSNYAFKKRSCSLFIQQRHGNMQRTVWCQQQNWEHYIQPVLNGYCHFTNSIINKLAGNGTFFHQENTSVAKLSHCTSGAYPKPPATHSEPLQTLHKGKGHPMTCLCRQRKEVEV
jgi:hypothetical protein